MAKIEKMKTLWHVSGKPHKCHIVDSYEIIEGDDYFESKDEADKERKARAAKKKRQKAADKKNAETGSEG